MDGISTVLGTLIPVHAPTGYAAGSEWIAQPVGAYSAESVPLELSAYY